MKLPAILLCTKCNRIPVLFFMVAAMVASIMDVSYITFSFLLFVASFLLYLPDLLPAKWMYFVSSFMLMLFSGLIFILVLILLFDFYTGTRQFADTLSFFTVGFLLSGASMFCAAWPTMAGLNDSARGESNPKYDVSRQLTEL